MFISTDIKPLSFEYFIEVLCKRLWLTAGIFLVFLALSAGYFVFSPAKYRTSTTILIEGANSAIPILGRQGISMNIKPSEVKDQIKIIKSRTIAERVGLRVGVRNVDKLLAMVDVQVPRNSVNILEMSVSGKDPVLIAKIANLWVQEYVGRIVEARKRTASESESQVIKGMDRAVSDLKDAESKLSAFEVNNPGVSEKAGIIDELEKKRLDLENRISEMTVRYKEEHPKVAALKASLDNIHQTILEERQRVEKDWDRIQEYERLNSNVKTYRKLNDDLLESSKNLRMAADLMPSNIQIIDEAGVPDKPLPKTGEALKLLIFGILISLGVSVLAEYLDHSFSHPEEVEAYAKMPVLAEVPFAGKSCCNSPALYKTTATDQTSALAEAFRSLKAFLFFAAPENISLNVIAVTGTFSGEGSSFIASNLAVTFAHAGEKTLLIDADMRNGVLGKAFEVRGGTGLTEAFSQGGVLPPNAIESTSIQNLFILSSGKNASLSSDLLGNSKVLKTLVDKVRADFQRVVIDVPAVLEHSDAVYWGEMCDGIIYVTGKRKTPFDKVLEGKKKLKKNDSKIIGAVLNDVGAEDFITEFAKTMAGKVSRVK